MRPSEAESGQGLPPARAVALAVIEDVLPSARGPGRDLQAVLDAALAAGRLDPRDAALATELVYGFIRLRGRVDAFLGRYLKHPEKLPPRAFLAMSLAAHEILRLDRVPGFASVNWAVGHVKALFGARLGGVANAVLRRVADEAGAALDPETYRSDGCDEAVALSRWYSCPEWIVRMWLGELGRERAEALLAAQAGPSPIGLRVNVRRDGGPEYFARLAGHPGCLRAVAPMAVFRPGADLGDLDLERAMGQGLISRQSPGSLAVLERLGVRDWPGPVWDACAGRGGKTMALLESRDVEVWASDPHTGRLAGLRGEFDRLGAPPGPVFVADARFPPLGRRPGTILLDAPCSGLGVLSRRPDIKWKLRPRQIRQLARLQAALLDAALAAVQPGGLVAYVTCTVSRAENEERVTALTAARRELRVERLAGPDWGGDAGECFFGALLRRRA